MLTVKGLTRLHISASFAFVATGGLALSETEVSQSRRDIHPHSVRCCCDRIEVSKTVIPNVAFGSWLCENAVARKIDGTNRSSDRNFSNNNFSARSALSRSKKAILLVSGRVEFLHNHGQSETRQSLYGAAG
jgi:hypothetical protein